MKNIVMTATTDDGAGRSYISGNEYTVQDSLAATFYAAGKCSYKSSIGDIAAQIDGLSGNVTGLVGPDGRNVNLFRRKTNIATMMRFGSLFSVGGAFIFTDNLLCTVPAHYDAVRLIFANANTVDCVLYGALVAKTERSDTVASKTNPIIDGVSYTGLVAGPNSTQLGWVPVTVAGSTTITIPAGSVANPTFLYSDWMPLSSVNRVDGGKFPLLMVRIGASAANPQTYVGLTDNATAALVRNSCAPHEYYELAQGVDGISVPSNFTTTWTGSNDNQFQRVIGVQVMTRGRAQTVMFAGDSIMLGTGSTAGAKDGYANKAFSQIASDLSNVGYANLSYPGGTTTFYSTLATNQLANIAPSVAVYAPESPNDSVTSGVTMDERLRAIKFIESCNAVGTQPILVTPAPCYLAGAQETARLAMVDWVRNSGVPYIDLHSVWYDPTNGAQKFWNAAYYNDGTHPNEAGHAAAMALAKSVIKSYL